EHVRRRAEPDDGGEILSRIEAERFVDERIDGERRAGRENEHIPVGRRLRRDGGADVAVTPAAIVDDELLPQGTRQRVGAKPARRIAAASRREGIDEAHRTRRVFARQVGAVYGESDQREDECNRELHELPAWYSTVDKYNGRGGFVRWQPAPVKRACRRYCR